MKARKKFVKTISAYESNYVAMHLYSVDKFVSVRMLVQICVSVWVIALKWISNPWCYIKNCIFGQNIVFAF